MTRLCLPRQVHRFAMARSAAMTGPVPISASAGPYPLPPKRPGRRERRTARALLDHSAWTTVAAAVAAVSAATTTAWPYAILVGRRAVTALLAGAPPDPPRPWRETARGWLIERRLLVNASDHAALRGSDTFVALGCCDGGAILLDLGCAPAFITVSGDQDRARQLLESLVLQLLAVPRIRVVVEAGVLPGTPVATVTGLADQLEDAIPPIDAEASWTFLVCAEPAPAQVARLRIRAAGDDRMRVLILGKVTGSRWSLRVGPEGDVIADGLALAASSRGVLDGTPAGRYSLFSTPAAAASHRPADDDDDWVSRVAAPRTRGRTPLGGVSLPAASRAFLDDELRAAVELHPALAPVPERDPRFGTHAPAQPVSAGSTSPAAQRAVPAASAGSEAAGAAGPAVPDDAVWMNRPDQRSLAEMHTVSGRDAGRVWPLGMGVHDIGSAPGSAIAIAGDGVPERGIRVTIGPTGQAWLTLPEDTGGISSLAGWGVSRCVTGEIPWPANCELMLGEVVLQISAPHRADAPLTGSPEGHCVECAQTPPAAPPIQVNRFRVPPPPAVPPRFPVSVPMMTVPLLAGIGVTWLLHSFLFLMFVLCYPACAAISGLSRWPGQRRAFWRELNVFKARRAAIYAEARQAVAHERAVRCHTFMDPARAALTALGPRPRPWERCHGHADHLVLRVGTVNQPSMVEIEDPSADDASRTIRWNLAGVPLGLDLAEQGVVVLTGDAEASRAVARWMVIQAAVLRDQRDLWICLLVDEPAQTGWGWVRWLPHAWPAGKAPRRIALADSIPEGADNRIGEVLSVINDRARSRATSSAGFREPDIIVVVELGRGSPDDAGMAQILSEGPARRVFTICLHEPDQPLPQECTAVVRCGPTALSVCQQDLPQVNGIRPDLITPAWCDRVARSLMPLPGVTAPGFAPAKQSDAG